jgi:protein KRI1
MPKRKAESLTQVPAVNENKKAKHEQAPKLNKANLLDDSDSSSEDESGGGALLEEAGFKINEEFAKRFEHNKKREELQRRECTLSNKYIIILNNSSGRKIREARKAFE